MDAIRLLSAVGALTVAGISWYILKNGKKTPDSNDNDSATGSKKTIVLRNADFGGSESLSLEVRRDFARYFSNGAVYLIRSAGTGTDILLDLKEFNPTVENSDFLAESNDATVNNFQELLTEQIRLAREQSFTFSRSTVAACVRCITINAGFKVAMDVIKFPMFLQPTFVVSVTPTELRVINYAYVGMNKQGPPGAQSTDKVARIVSPNLFEVTPAGLNDMHFSFDIRDTSQTNILEQINLDLKARKGKFW